MAQSETELYWFETTPGDRDHLPSYYFDEGVVEADPVEIAALLETLRAEHESLVTIEPLADHIKTIDELRVMVGAALAAWHGEDIKDTKPCATDAPFIAAHQKDTYG